MYSIPFNLYQLPLYENYFIVSCVKYNKRTDSDGHKIKTLYYIIFIEH